MSRVTLQQVAAHAGVSRATASLILRGSSQISDSTRDKVMKSMHELGYVYDRVAANLRSHRSSTVGLIITEIANPFFAELLVGVHQELDDFGYSVILGTTFDLMSKQERLLASMLEYRAGGVILCPVSESSYEVVDILQQWDIPVVLVAKELPGAKCDYVGVDNVHGAELAVEHLVNLGHHRIAFLGGPTESSPWRERKQGYYNILRKFGLEIIDSLIFPSPATREGGIDAIKRALSLPSLPTAAFCFNDVVAIGVMQGLMNSDLYPGKDMAIVGFDDIPEVSIFTPGLTTISSSPRLIGKYAAQLLHKRMFNLGTDDTQRIILNPELIIRDSTK